ncbi:MAG TPA: hypothetical protein VMA71_06855 [Alloacidobacterium sp.]|nr:hypothetical protein [Alloacidobacterium sp.]
MQPHIVNSLEIEWVRTDSGALPIHRAYYGGTDASILVAYLLVYRSSAIGNPYWAQLRAAPVELFSGRRPMTLFLVQARGSPGTLREMEKVEQEWLVSSWEKYGSACTY